MPRLRVTPPSLDAYVRAELHGESVCPFCLQGSVVPGTRAADEFGCCLMCYHTALKRAVEARARDMKSGKVYQAARKAASRAGIPLNDIEPSSDDLLNGKVMTDAEFAVWFGGE